VSVLAKVMLVKEEKVEVNGAGKVFHTLYVTGPGVTDRFVEVKGTMYKDVDLTGKWVEVHRIHEKDQGVWAAGKGFDIWVVDDGATGALKAAVGEMESWYQKNKTAIAKVKTALEKGKVEKWPNEKGKRKEMEVSLAEVEEDEVDEETLAALLKSG